jgi:hypothetical protein
MEGRDSPGTRCRSRCVSDDGVALSGNAQANASPGRAYGQHRPEQPLRPGVPEGMIGGGRAHCGLAAALNTVIQSESSAFGTMV